MKWNELTDEMQVRLYWSMNENEEMTFTEFDEYMRENFGDFDIYFVEKGE